MQDLCQTYARSTHLRFCLGIIITPRHLRKCLGIYENAGITILPLTYIPPNEAFLNTFDPDSLCSYNTMRPYKDTFSPK
jgi:hypothetical protein